MLGTDWYKRWRHGRGFGIHSPSAYRLVREVLRPGSRYAYYDYAEIARARGICANLLPQSELELLYRIMTYFRPATLHIHQGPSYEILAHIVRLALPQSTMECAENAEMVIYEEKGDAPYPGQAKYIYFTDSTNPLLRQIIDSITHGHIFCNPSRALVVVNPKLPKQIFQISY